MKRLLKIASIFAGIGVVLIIVSVCMGMRFPAAVRVLERCHFGPDGWEYWDSDYEKGTYQEVLHNYEELNIDVDAGKLEIVYADVDEIQVDSDYPIDMEGDSDSVTLSLDKKESESVLYIPRGKTIRELNLSVGAGKVEIEAVDIKELDVELGAGKADISLPRPEEEYSYQVECGMGRIRIGDSNTYSMVNEQEVVRKNGYGEINIECGIGEVNIDFASAL